MAQHEPDELPAHPKRERPSRALLAWIGIPILAGITALALIALIHEPEYVVLVRGSEAQARWFGTALEPFAAEHHADIEVRIFGDADDLTRQLGLDRRARKPRVLLVQAPQEALAPLVSAGLVRPLEGLDGIDRVDKLAASFVPEAYAGGRIDGTLYFLPRELETHCLYYSRSRVAEAVEHWSVVRDSVHAWLVQANGHGLPQGYTLEPQPSSWDSYDVAVVAAYWASVPFGGLQIPRVGHRTRRYSGTALELATRAFAMHARADELLNLEGTGLVDALAWESFFLRHGLYHPAMLREGWQGGDLYTAIAQDQVWLCLLSPSELFLVRGGGDTGGYLRDRDDFGIALVPAGASLEQNGGRPRRTGGRYAVRYGKWWGVPRSVPDAGLAGALLAHVTSPAFAARECRAFGLYPARRDLHRTLEDVFPDGWSRDIMRLARRQLFALGRPLPTSPGWIDSERALVNAWYDVCVRLRLTDGPALARALRSHAPEPIAESRAVSRPAEEAQASPAPAKSESRRVRPRSSSDSR